MPTPLRQKAIRALLALALFLPRPAAAAKAVGPIFFDYPLPPFPTWRKAIQPIPFIELGESSKFWLVRARVVKVDETPFSSTRRQSQSFQPDELVIEESFTGPDLTGQHYQITDPHLDGHFLVTSPEMSTARYSVGEELLISLMDDSLWTGAATSQFRVSYDRVSSHYGLDPVVEIKPNRWRAEHLKYAAKIREAYSAKPEKLEALLRQYARSDDSALAIWATHTLAFWIDNTNPVTPTPVYPLTNRQASLKWLKNLTKDKRRPVEQQLALEDMLHRIDASHWDAAPQRSQFLQRLCQGPMTSLQEWEIESYFKDREAYREVGLAQSQVDGLVASLRKNLQWPLPSSKAFDIPPKTADLLSLVAQNLSHHSPEDWAFRLTDNLIDGGELPLGSEADVALILQNLRAGFDSCPDEVSWNNSQRAISMLESMKFGVHYARVSLLGGVVFGVERSPESQK